LYHHLPSFQLKANVMMAASASVPEVMLLISEKQMEMRMSSVNALLNDAWKTMYELIELETGFRMSNLQPEQN